jgi:hypothetical protein
MPESNRTLFSDRGRNLRPRHFLFSVASGQIARPEANVFTVRTDGQTKNAPDDAPRVASELGHTSPQMLFNNYREVVLPEEAERYWKITPANAENLVSFDPRVSQS